MPSNRLQEAIRPGDRGQRQDLKPNNDFLQCFSYFELQLSDSGYCPFL